MKIATWNINGVKARLDRRRHMAQGGGPDVACFQEIKTHDEAFPAEAFEALGYNVAVHGQKGFNGVAILSKLPLRRGRRRGLPGDEGDDHARYIEAVFSCEGGVVRVGALYLPNGNPPAPTSSPTSSPGWSGSSAHARVAGLEEPFLLLGDYNVIPDRSTPDPTAWPSDALFQPETRAAFRALLNLGLTDAFRACHAEPGTYTFWDYQAGAWQKDHGIRIDHILLMKIIRAVSSRCLALHRGGAAGHDRRTRARTR